MNDRPLENQLSKAVGKYIAEVCSVVAKYPKWTQSYCEAEYMEKNEILDGWRFAIASEPRLNSVLIGLEFFREQKTLGSASELLASIESLNSLPNTTLHQFSISEWRLFPNHFEMALWNFIVHEYLELCWKRLGKIDWNSDLFEEIYISRTQEIEDGYESTTTLVAPITWLKVPVEPIELEKGVMLRRLSALEIEDWFNESWKFDGRRHDIDLQSLSSCIEIRIGLSSDEIRLENFAPYTAKLNSASEKIETILGVLRLITNSDIKNPFIQRRTSGLLTRMYLIEKTNAPRTTQLLTRKETLSAIEQDELKRFWKKFTDDSNNSHLALPFRRWSGAWDRKNVEDKLIDYWIGLESLYAQDGTNELKFRASMRIAAYLGRDFYEQKSIHKQMAYSYDWRSAIVHGSDSPKSKKKREAVASLADSTNTTGKYLRDTILLQLNSEGRFPTLSDSKVELEILRHLNDSHK